jgi:hypothetical protein
MDGREYPEHLRPYAAYDAAFLPIAARFREFTFDDLAATVPNPKLRSVLPRWLASAEWRGLIERRDRDMASMRVNALTERGLAQLQAF